MPSWSLTTRQSEILGSFKDDGEQQAHHACTCKTTECPWHFAEVPTWLTPEYFKQWLNHRLSTLLKSIPEPDGDSEDAIRQREMRDNFKMYLDQWMSMSDAELISDPRYRAYECGFNTKLLEFITSSLSYRVPKYV